MRIDTERQGDIAVLALDGELDASNYEDVIRAARTAYAEGARHLVLDLGELSYMGSAGLVALHAAGLIFQGIEPPGGEAGWDALTQFGADVSTSRFHEVMWKRSHHVIISPSLHRPRTARAANRRFSFRSIARR